MIDVFTILMVVMASWLSIPSKLYTLKKKITSLFVFQLNSNLFYNFIYLFIFGCAASSLLLGLSLGVDSRGYFSLQSLCFSCRRCSRFRTWV